MGTLSACLLCPFEIPHFYLFLYFVTLIEVPDLFFLFTPNFDLDISPCAQFPLGTKREESLLLLGYHHLLVITENGCVLTRAYAYGYNYFCIYFCDKYVYKYNKINISSQL